MQVKLCFRVHKIFSFVQRVNLPVHDFAEFTGQKISVMVHFEFVGMVSLQVTSIVFGDPLLIFHEDFHTESVFLLGSVVFL